jgi:type IV/VI secretion system ImpK/VasF family protein
MLVNQLSIPDSCLVPQSYYRSKLFVSAYTTNPLVAAASPILSLMERLCLSPTLPPIEIIRENIQHEIFAFHSRLISQKYAHEFIVIANYLLTATIDELIGKNYLRLFNKNAEFQAFTPPSIDGIEPQSRFFEVLHFIKKRANQYLDLIELAYYCMITGFEGEQHVRADGRQTLDNLIEELYQLIQQHRVNKPHRLFKLQEKLTKEPKTHKPLTIAILIAIGIISLTYFASNSLIDQKTQALIIGHIPQHE